MKHILAIVVIVIGWFIFQPCSWWIVFAICLAIEAHRFVSRLRRSKLTNADLLEIAKRNPPPQSWYEEPESDPFVTK